MVTFAILLQPDSFGTNEDSFNLEVGLVDEVKDVVDKWMGRWLDV
jgi:hypothetical protein